MDNYSNEFIGRAKDAVERAGRAIKKWWLLLICGLLAVAASVVVFCNPASSFEALSLMFAIMLLVSGAAEVILTVTNRNFFIVRSSSILGAVLDVLLGIFLLVYPAVSYLVLPITLGVASLYHSIQIISLASNLSLFRLPRVAWISVGGVLMLIASILILIMPLTVGRAAIVIITGIALMFGGLFMTALSLKLRKIHNAVRSQYPGPDYGD